MSKRHHPKRGSMGYSPRKRARNETPHMPSWPDNGTNDQPHIQGFAGYKVGMTHILAVDYRKTSTTTGQEVRMPATVVEVPPMMVAGVRGYIQSPYGLKTEGEVWAENFEKELAMRVPLPKGQDRKAAWRKLEQADLEDVRLICYTQPKLVTGIPKKRPEIMENRIAGGTIPDRLDFARERMGKAIDVSDFVKPGQMVDTLAITRGKGFQGHIQRWGLKLLTHKNSKHRRMVGTLGPWHPAYVRREVPQAGQMGYHHRTEYNKRVIKMGENGEEITPAGGFLHYGVLQNSYLLLHGSLPGPSKRLIRMRHPIRFRRYDVEPQINYISLASPQGV